MTRRMPERDWVDAYYAHGLDVVNRRVWVTGEITAESANEAAKGLYLLDSISSTEPCELFVNSHGGDLVATQAIYDILQTLRCNVHTFAFGECQSAAPLLLAAGTPGHRWVAANTEFMTHDSWGEIEGKAVEMRAYLEHMDALGRRWMSLLTDHSKMPITHWRSICNKKVDYYFGSEEAIKWGLADNIWNEREV